MRETNNFKNYFIKYHKKIIKNSFPFENEKLNKKNSQTRNKLPFFSGTEEYTGPKIRKGGVMVPQRRFWICSCLKWQVAQNDPYVESDFARIFNLKLSTLVWAIINKRGVGTPPHHPTPHGRSEISPRWWSGLVKLPPHPPATAHHPPPTTQIGRCRTEEKGLTQVGPTSRWENTWFPHIPRSTATLRW